MANKIISIASSGGQYPVLPSRITEVTAQMYGKKEAQKMRFLARTEAIQQKFSVLPDFDESCDNPVLFNDFDHLPGTAARMQVFQKEALALSEKVAKGAIQKARLTSENITHIITVTCTGAYAPGLDIELSNRLQLQNGIKRHAVNFMGCYAAFHALRLADMICDTTEHANVLIVCTELCTLHLRKDTSNDNLLSTYLFSDGAAACIMTNNETGTKKALECQLFDSALVPKGHEDMGWYIGDDGFQMILSNKVPAHIKAHIGEVFHRAIDQLGLSTNDIQHYAIHPGGKNILDAFAEALDIPKEALAISYDILSNYGNMSSATTLFVLQKMLEQEKVQQSRKEWLYAAAFGPGITIENALFKLTH